jgi:hypothetical protein
MNSWQDNRAAFSEARAELERERAASQTRASARNHGAGEAQRAVIAAADAGRSASHIDAAQADAASGLLSAARTAPQLAYAAGYNDAAGVLTRELRELDEPEREAGG